MDVSTVVLIFGFVMLIVSLKFLTDGKSAASITKDITSSPGLMFISGLISLILGSVIVVTYGPEYADSHMKLLASVLGFILVLVGVTRLLFSESFGGYLRSLTDGKHRHITTGITFIISVVLMLVGTGTITLS